jgi:hypothetical protein
MREDVMEYEGISEEEREEAASYRTAELVVDTIREHFLIRDFIENGLTAGSSDAHDFFAGRSRGWAGWAERFGGWSGSWSGSWGILCEAVTGLDFQEPLGDS